MGRGSRDFAALAATLALLVMVGFLVARDYGAGFDARRNSIVGWNALQSYWSPVRYAAYLSDGEAVAQHGPSYFMVFSVTSRIWRRLFPGWHISDGRNFTNYLVFLAAAAAVYLLMLRLVPRRYAWIGMLLFVTQPLLFGHGFINQKDTPFMGFFAVSVIVGMAAAEQFQREERRAQAGNAESGGAWTRVRAEWRSSRVWKRWIAAAYLLLAAAVVLDILLFGKGFAALQDWIAAGYPGTAWPAYQALFDRFMPSASETPPATMLLQFSLAYWVGRAVLLALILGLAGRVAAAAMPMEFARVFGRHRIGIGMLILAGGLTGFTISIRPIGAFAGALILLYWLWKNGLRGMCALLLFGVAAGLTAYLTWPYLWEAPVSRLLESLSLTADFPVKATLYRGHMVKSNHLPWHYFPTLVSIELTEVVIPLFIAGLGIAVARARKMQVDRAVLTILLVWLLVPLFALWFLGMGIYNNIKHLHFILVPLFVFSSVGLEGLLELLPPAWLRWGAVALILTPGVVGIIQLHPYEYTYFNSLVGGVKGASGRYTLDRFCVSSREAMEYVNQTAEEGALVAAPGAPFAASEFARDDLQVSGMYGAIVANADFVITCSFYLGFPQGDADWEDVHDVSRQGVVYAEVWKWTGEPR